MSEFYENDVIPTFLTMEKYVVEYFDSIEPQRNVEPVFVFSVNDWVKNEAQYGKGFTSSITIGKLGTGKSAYAIQACGEALYILYYYKGKISQEAIEEYHKLYREEDDIISELLINEVIRKRLLHTIKDLRKIHEVEDECKSLKEKGYQLSLMGEYFIFDDAGIALNPKLWLVKGGTIYFTLWSMYFQVIRTFVTCLILTAPNLQYLSSCVKGIMPNIILVEKGVGSWVSYARVYEVLEKVPSGHRIARAYAINRFLRKLPDKVYNYYNPIRERYARVAQKQILENIKLIMEKFEEGGVTYFRQYMMELEEIGEEGDSSRFADKIDELFNE